MHSRSHNKGVPECLQAQNRIPALGWGWGGDGEAVFKAWLCCHLTACFWTGSFQSLGSTTAFHPQGADSFQNPPAQVAIHGWVQVGMAHPGSGPQHLPTILFL